MDTIIIKLLNLNMLQDSSEYSVFDALRDNHGQGLKATDLLKYLKKTLD